MHPVTSNSNFSTPLKDKQGDTSFLLLNKIFQENVLTQKLPETSRLEKVKPLSFDSLKTIVNLPIISPDNIERKSLLFHLKKDVISYEWNLVNSTIVKILYGTSGIGKTDLAITFGHKNRDLFSLIWFIPCGTRGLYEKSYRELAEVLNIPDQNDLISELINEVHLKLDNGIDGKKPWLLIFDNVCEIQKVDSIPKNGGYILMTAQHPTIWWNKNDWMQIPCFNDEEAKELLKQDGNQKESAQMKILINELGGYPILVNAARRSIGSYESLDEYVNLIQSQEAALWEIKQALRYPKVMGPVFHLLFEQIKKNSPLAFEFLELLAFLNPDFIPLHFFEFWLNENDASVEKSNILKILTDQGMIHFDEVKETLSIHPLQQQVIQAISTKEKNNAVITYLAKWSKGFSVGEPETWKIGAGCFFQISKRSDDPFWEKIVDQTDRMQILSVCESWVGKIIGNETVALDIQKKMNEIQAEPSEEPQAEPSREALVLDSNERRWRSGPNLIFGGGVVLAVLAASYFYSKSKN